MVEKIKCWLKDNKILIGIFLIIALLYTFNLFYNYGYVTAPEKRIPLSIMRVMEKGASLKGTYDIKSSKTNQGNDQNEKMIWIIANSIAAKGTFSFDAEEGVLDITGEAQMADAASVPVDLSYDVPSESEIRKLIDEINPEVYSSFFDKVKKKTERKKIKVKNANLPYYLESYVVETDLKKLIEAFEGETIKENEIFSDIENVPITITLYIDRDCYFRGLELEAAYKDFSLVGEVSINEIQEKLAK